jgi:hypothetical protein
MLQKHTPYGGGRAAYRGKVQYLKSAFGGLRESRMTKTSGTLGTRTKKAAERKLPAKRVKVSLRARAEDAIDGCAVGILKSETTADIELPPAKGGVGRRGQRSSKK